MGYKQYKSFLTFDLGFKTENILNIKLQGNQAELLIKALSERPEVTAISRSLIVMSLGSRYGTTDEIHEQKRFSTGHVELCQRTLSAVA